MWASYDNIPKAIFYLLKVDYRVRVPYLDLAGNVAGRMVGAYSWRYVLRPSFYPQLYSTVNTRFRV